MPLDEIEDQGQTWKLGYVEPDESAMLMRAERTNIQDLREAAGMERLIHPEEYEEVDYVTDYPLDLICDQGHQGSCTAWSCVGANARQRYIRTGEIIIPSGYFIYDLVNHGHDNGSNIIDSMNAVERIGAPPIPAYPKCLFSVPSPPAGAPMYKEDLACTVSDSAECATALMMGMFPQVPIKVTGSFGSFTSDGVAWNGVAPRGSGSNHSIYLAGMRKVNGVMYFILVNSWKPGWGPWKIGACLIPFDAVDNPATSNDGYCHGSVSGGA